MFDISVSMFDLVFFFYTIWVTFSQGPFLTHTLLALRFSVRSLLTSSINFSIIIIRNGCPPPPKKKKQFYMLKRGMGSCVSSCDKRKNKNL